MGLSYFTEGLFFNVELQENAYECAIGPFGIIVDDPLDCEWMHYKLNYPF
jgi:hypothetical protein